MFSKIVYSSPDQANPVVGPHRDNKMRLFSLLLIIAILTSCSPPGGNQTQVIPAPTTQPQFPDCKTTDTGFCWPTGKVINKPYNWLANNCGWSEYPTYKGNKYHTGVDIKANVGNSVYAIADGIVKAVSRGKNSGWQGDNNGENNVGVVVEHTLADGTTKFIAVYGHIVLPGKDPTKVVAGESFATIGPYNNEPHLHFGIRPGTSISGRLGALDCPQTLGTPNPTPIPIRETSGFVDPIDWITTKSPMVGSVLGATAVQEENPTPTAPIPVPGATPIREQSLPFAFTSGDYLVYNRTGNRFSPITEVVLERYEFVGTELVDKYNTWVVVLTTDASKMPGEESSNTTTLWVDKDTGMIVKSIRHAVNSTPISSQFDSQQIDIVEFTELSSYNSENDEWDTIRTYIDTAGKQHEQRLSYLVPVAYLITYNVQIGEWYPEGEEFRKQQVASEETISVIAGSFDCWVFDFSGSKDGTIGYFDKRTGIQIKQEYWKLNNNGEREIIEQTQLASFNLANWDARQTSLVTTPENLDRADYFSVLQWIKYAFANNYMDVFEELVIGDLGYVSYIEGGDPVTRSAFLDDLSTRLPSGPHCDSFTISDGRLDVWSSGWSPKWVMDQLCHAGCDQLNPPATSDVIAFSLTNEGNGWHITAIPFGARPDWWADTYKLDVISCDTISLSVGNVFGSGSLPSDLACKEVRPTRLKDGDFAFISFYPPLDQRVRRGYGTTNSILDTIPPGTAVKIIDGPECANNWVWWKIRVLNSDLEGWTSEGDQDAYWLIPCESRNNCGTR